MAIRNFSYTRVALSLFTVIVVAACQTAPPAHQLPARTTHPQPAPVVVPGMPSQPPPLTQTLPPQEPPKPEQPATPPVREEPRKVAVILGPGGAKAFAHVGVLKSLQHQRIPIDKIIGLEWGALMAALYADKGQVNDVEWKLYKMEQKGLPMPKGFFSSHKLGDESVKVMDEFLQESFGSDDASRLHVPYACPSRSVWTGVVAWQTKGALKDAVKRCLAFPPLFKASGTFLAGASQALEAIDLLRREGYNTIILVNVLGSALPVAQDSLLDYLNYVILWQEIKRAIVEASRYNVEYVNVDTSAYPMVQFESKKELISLGEKEGNAAAQILINKYGF